MSSDHQDPGAGRWDSPECDATRAALDERLRRLNSELNRTWAEARVRRSQLRRQRIQLRAQMQLRRAAGHDFDRRAAAAILEAALSVSGLTMSQLWLDYVALGGSATRAELSAMVAGTGPIDRPDHDRIASALNERLDDGGFGRPLSYWDSSR